MTELQLFINDVAVDMFGKTAIPITRQAVKFAELKPIGDYSMKFSIPNTAQNRAVFNDSIEVTSFDRSAYKRQQARIDIGGVMLQGFTTIESVSHKTISLAFYTGNSNIFSLIGNSTLNDLDFSELSHQFIAANVYASRTNKWSEGYIYPIVNTSATNAGLGITPEIKMDYMIPMLFVRYIFEKIFSNHGFKIDGDAIADEMFNNLIVDMKKNIADPNQINCSWLRAADTAPQGINANAPNPLVIIGGGDTEVTDPSSFINLSAGQYQFTPLYPSGRYDLSFQINVGYNQNGATAWTPANATTFLAGVKDFAIYKNNIWQMIDSFIGVSYPPDAIINGAPNPVWKKIVKEVRVRVDGFVNSVASFDNDLGIINKTIVIEDVVVNSSAVFEVVCNYYSGFAIPAGGVPSVYIKAGTEFQCTDAFLDYVANGLYFNPTKCMHELTQAEFLKGISSMMGFVFNTNNDNKVVYINKFQNYKDRLEIAEDVSVNTLNAEDDVVEYKPNDYAKLNEYKWNDNDDTDKEVLVIPDGYCAGSFVIDNDLLADKKTIIELPFSASSSLVAPYGVDGIRIPHILKYETTPVAEPRWREMNPRILLLNQTDASSANIDLLSIATGVSVLATYTNSFPFALFYAPESEYDLTWNSLLARNYEYFIKVVQNYKYIKTEMMLDPEFIYGFDFSIPIYISKYGSYFVLMKFSNYVFGKPVKVELLKLN